eukprot:SAG31_NODE_1045_length_10180_cov_5.454221_7_plen_101_part_00
MSSEARTQTKVQNTEAWRSRPPLTSQSPAVRPFKIIKVDPYIGRPLVTALRLCRFFETLAMCSLVWSTRRRAVINSEGRMVCLRVLNANVVWGCVRPYDC